MLYLALTKRTAIYNFDLFPQCVLLLYFWLKWISHRKLQNFLLSLPNEIGTLTVSHLIMTNGSSQE